MAFESLDGSFRVISVMNMQGVNMVEGVFIETGLLEDITSFIFHNLSSGLLTSSRERVWFFFTPLLMHAPDLDGRD